MDELPIPQAMRLKRPSWRDPRLLVGLILVLLATTMGAKLIAGADDRVSMYAAAQPLKPGDRLTTENLTPVDVELGPQSAVYLPAADGPPVDRFVLRPVAQGELVPMAAVGAADRVAVQPVTVTVVASSLTSLRAGTVVDVWVSSRDVSTTQERYLDPTRTLERVTVAAVPQDQTRFGASAATAAVQILVPREKVGAIIAASDQQARFTLVPAPGSSSGT